MCAREPRLFGRLRAALAALAGAWHVWQGGARGPRGGGAPARAHLARTTCPRRHSDSANSWVNFQHLPCFHGLVLTYYYNYYVQEVAQHSGLSHTAVRPSCKMENVLDAERCLAIHGQWTMDSESQAPAGCMLLRSSTSGKVDVLGGGTWFPRALCCAESVAGTSGHRKRYRLHDWKRFRDSAPRLRQTTLRSAYATF